MFIRHSQTADLRATSVLCPTACIVTTDLGARTSVATGDCHCWAQHALVVPSRAQAGAKRASALTVPLTAFARAVLHDDNRGPFDWAQGRL